MQRNTTRSYGSIARTFHWLTALIILVNIGLGLIAVRLPMEQLDAKVQMFSLHKTLGLLAFAVAILRILWAIGQPRPVPVHPDRKLETLLAEIAHWLLYGLMVLVPLTGWIEHAATDGFAPILWPLGQGLPLVPKSPEFAQVMASVHHVLAWVLIATITLHVVGALKHTLIDRDGVLGRMLRGTPAGSEGVQHHALPAAIAVVILGAAMGYGLWRPAGDEPAVPALEQAESQWEVTEGSLAFSIVQMGSAVTGQFSDWTAAINFDPETGTGDVEVTINLDSVTIGMVTEQAKGPAFFDVANHPVAVFRGQIRPEGDGFVAEGPLSMKGQEATVTLPFTLQIEGDTATMSGQTVMDRRNWNIGEGYDDEGSVGFPVTLEVSLSAQR